MELKERINAFSNLGQSLNNWILLFESNQSSPLDTAIRQAFHHNGWFSEDQVLNSLKELAYWLNKNKLEDWINNYSITDIAPKTVGVIMPGNIPLVGFHDYLSVLLSGHKLLGKLSSKDEILPKFIHNELLKIEPRFAESVDFSTQRFTNVDAVIATGSDNSSRYFEYYFAKKPHIIRKNRTSIAVLEGKETKEDLFELGKDVFGYYGLGCRNVTKLYLPKNFDRDWLYSGIIDHADIINNHKYQNNYDYHKSLYLLNQDEIWDNNFLLLKNDTSISSPIGVLFYEEYDDIKTLETELSLISDQIQCRIGVNGFPFGYAQKPELTDYADDIDVLQFLIGL